ncbi:hypothetical protein ES705_50178 [subsurface metagenome]
MAKLKAPLMSLGASGKLGGALVFMHWKGIDDVREYVIPANPRTPLQTTQRGYLTDAVVVIHAAQADPTNPLDSEDAQAYALYGSCEPTPRTWFNQIVKNWIDCKVATKLPCLCSNMEITPAPGELGLSLYLWEATCTAGKFYYGTSKTALINSEDAVITTQTATATLTGLTPGVKYFVQFRADPADPCEGARSGIYYDRPTSQNPAGPPLQPKAKS